MRAITIVTIHETTLPAKESIAKISQRKFFFGFLSVISVAATLLSKSPFRISLLSAVSSVK